MQWNERIAKLILILSMLVMGACGLMYEYVLSVMGNYLMGTSHEQIFIIIGLMLFAMGIGSLVQRVVTANLLEAFLLIEISIGLLGGFSGIAIYAAHANWESFEIILYSFAFLIGAFIGMEIPILIRINERYSSSLRINLSEILSVDYVGSLIGAFLFTYVLLIHFSLAKIGFLLGITNATLGLISLIYFWKLIKYRYSLSIVIILVLPSLLLGFFRSDDWTLNIEQKYYRDPIVIRKTSRYQHIVLTRMKKRINLYINGHLQFSSMDEHIYHEYLVHIPMTLANSRKNILVLGGGDGLAVREILKYPEVERVVLVDIDPAITELARTNPYLKDLNGGSLQDARTTVIPAGGIKKGEKLDIYIPDRRLTSTFKENYRPVAKVHLFHLDADKFISKVRGKFDVVIIDFPDPGVIELAKLYSFDFYRSLRKQLLPHSLISVQSSSPFYARNAFLCIGKTLRHAGLNNLPYHGTVPSFMGEWGWYLAWADPSLSSEEMKQRIRSQASIPVKTNFLSRNMLVASFVFGKNLDKGRNDIRINTKMNPILSHYYRESWKHW